MIGMPFYMLWNLPHSSPIPNLLKPIKIHILSAQNCQIIYLLIHLSLIPLSLIYLYIIHTLISYLFISHSFKHTTNPIVSQCNLTLKISSPLQVRNQPLNCKPSLRRPRILASHSFKESSSFSPPLWSVTKRRKGYRRTLEKPNNFLLKIKRLCLGLRLLLGCMWPMRPALKTWKTPNPNIFTAWPPIQTARWNVLAPTKNSQPNCKLTHRKNPNANTKNPQSQSSTTCGHSSARPNNKKTLTSDVKEKTRITRTYQLLRDGQNQFSVTLSAWKRRGGKI